MPDEVKAERYARFMQTQQVISEEILASRVGKTIDVLIDTIDTENDEAVARSKWDAPEIDGNVFIPGATDLKVGEIVRVKIIEAEEYDLVGARIEV